jgi:hypothetical protein
MGYVVPQNLQERRLLPAPGSAHQWMTMAVFKVDDLVVQAVLANKDVGPDLIMDTDALVSVVGPKCLKCDLPLTTWTAGIPCLVNVTYAPDCGPDCVRDHGDPGHDHTETTL